MTCDATGDYRFGDLLALARRSWIRRMGDELERRGYPGYRVADAASMRMLLRGPLPIGSLGHGLGITRQAARKVARQLQQRGYATTAFDPDDARKVMVVLTDQGRAYARAIVEVIASLNQALAERVNPDQLVAADIVLRAAITDDDELSVVAQRIPAPTRTPRSLIKPPEGQGGIEITESADRPDLRSGGGGWPGPPPYVASGCGAGGMLAPRSL